MKLVIQPAKSFHLVEIAKLLLDNQLPTEDIHENKIKFFVALVNNVVVGTIGIEKYNHLGLQRSLAVNKEFRNLNIGEKLLKHLFDYSTSEKIRRLYLLTTTAEDYFNRFGFQAINRTDVPEVISNTKEFQDICPQSAVTMFKNQ